MDRESDLLLAELKDGKRRDVESFEVKSEPPASPKKQAWETFKRVFPACLNVFTYLLAGTYLIPVTYSRDLGKHWYSSFLLPYALFCYAFGTLVGLGVKFAEGHLLSTYFPRRFASRRFTLQDLQDLGAAGYWNQWLIVFCTCLYVELTASLVGMIKSQNAVLKQEYPGVFMFTVSWFALEPSTVIVILLMCVMALPMWHNTMFDLTWVGLSPLFLSDKFPWGFPIYRILVGNFSNLTKLNKLHNEQKEAKAAAQKHLTG